MMDKGGLWHVMEPTYALFLSIEEEIRDCLKTLVTSTPHLNVKPSKRSPTAKMYSYIG